MNIYTWIIAGSWITFLVVWIVLGSYAKKNLNTSWRWLLARGLIFIAVFALFRADILHWGSGYSLVQVRSPILAALGAALSVLGIAFAIWARVCLGRNWGMPMSVKESPELVTEGPYAYVRHPIYTGILFAIVGSGLAIGLIWLVPFVIASIYFVYSAVSEERLMAKEFPHQYPPYMARTKMLIPFIF